MEDSEVLLFSKIQTVKSSSLAKKTLKYFQGERQDPLEKVKAIVPEEVVLKVGISFAKDYDSFTAC